MQLSELLQWLSTGLKTGTLVVRGAPGEKRIYFNNGRVTSSSSTLEREHLGRFLVGFGFITEEELIRALEVQQESRILLGKILVMIGAIKEEELANLVRLKAAETIYDMFLWTEGSFAFIDGEIPSLPMVPISSDVTGIVMEGLRRYDEWQRIKTRIPTMRAIPAVVLPVEEELGERDKMILGATNGHRAIDQIALETHNPDFHVAKLMYDLMLTGHVRLVGEREETAAEPVFEEVESDGGRVVLVRSADVGRSAHDSRERPSRRAGGRVPARSSRAAHARPDRLQPVPQARFRGHPVEASGSAARRQRGHAAQRETRQDREPEKAGAAAAGPGPAAKAPPPAPAAETVAAAFSLPFPNPCPESLPGRSPSSRSPWKSSWTSRSRHPRPSSCRASTACGTCVRSPASRPSPRPR